MSDLVSKEELGGHHLLFATLDLLDVTQEPVMGQAIEKFKELVLKMSSEGSHQILALKLKALLKVRDDLLLKLGTPVVSSSVIDNDLSYETDADKQAREELADSQANVTDYLEKVLQVLEDTSNSSDDYTGSLEKGIDELSQTKSIEGLRELTQNLIGSSATMMDATRVFQAGIGEMAAMMLDFQRKVADLEMELAHQKEIALVDKLTSVHNRRAFDMRLEESVAHARRFHTPLSLCLLDLDHFKEINDQFGHDVGDDVLRSFARLIRTSCREYDMVFRFGGDEFAVILPNEGMEEGRTFAERIQSFMRNNAYRLENQEINIGISGGMAQLGEDDTSDLLFKRADRRLYEAKQLGRNQIRYD